MEWWIEAVHTWNGAPIHTGPIDIQWKRTHQCPVGVHFANSGILETKPDAVKLSGTYGSPDGKKVIKFPT